MKRNPLLLLCLMSLIGCSDDYFDNLPMPNESTAQVRELNDVQKDIMINILASKYGGYNKNQKISRAIDDVSFKPYVEDGDTLMYIVQYPEGWELYSAKRSSNMLLFTSESGQLSLSDPNLPPALRILINNSAAEIKENAIAYSDSIHPSWGAAALSTQDIEAGKTSIDSSKFTKIGKISRGEDDDLDDGYEDNEIQEGGWVLIGEEIVSSSTYTSDKLIKTKWGQTYPWNIYAPLAEDTTGTYIHCFAGCVPVAIAQYLYFTHYKDDFPKYAMSSYEFDQSSYKYSFSIESSTIWDEMAYLWYNVGTEYSALLIGSIGVEFKTKYGLDKSIPRVNIKDKLNELYKEYNISFSKTTRDLTKIRNSINQGYPLYSEAYSTKKVNNTAIDKTGHAFLIDQYKTNYFRTKYLYGWEGPYRDQYGNLVDTNDRDEDGNIIGWAITNEIERTNSYTYYSMNWGWDGSYDNTFYYCSDSSWSAGGFLWNKNFYIYTRSDVE